MGELERAQMLGGSFGDACHRLYRFRSGALFEARRRRYSKVPIAAQNPIQSALIQLRFPPRIRNNPAAKTSAVTKISIAIFIGNPLNCKIE